MIRRLLLAAAGLLAAAAVALSLAWTSTPDVAPLAKRTPPTTALINQRREEARKAGKPFRPQWSPVPLDAVSQRLVDAVIVAEDASFYGHHGLDFDEIGEAVEKDLATRSFARGASTITQQLAKNLYLGTEKSLWRKLKEAVIAVKLERALSKRRILTLYLNVVEWGDGVFGIQAASTHHFGVGAGALSTAQAAALAAMLPAPRASNPKHPSPRLERLAARILERLSRAGRLSQVEYEDARKELDALWGEPTAAGGEDEPEDDPE
jgi:monofunctional biosynthetic peptidoglycan transglycosylase